MTLYCKLCLQALSGGPSRVFSINQSFQPTFADKDENYDVDQWSEIVENFDNSCQFCPKTITVTNLKRTRVKIQSKKHDKVFESTAISILHFP